LTGDRDLIGTPSFLAPEQALGLDELDPRCDIYSLGAVAYFIVTGVRVFDAEQPLQVVMQHVNDTPEPPSTRTELSIPPVVDATILRCLEKSPENRPTARELQAELAGWPS
ncbi:MAG: serine/threonine protein kinase, partial [Myxococcota bacterium]